MEYHAQQFPIYITSILHVVVVGVSSLLPNTHMLYCLFLYFAKFILILAFQIGYFGFHLFAKSIMPNHQVYVVRFTFPLNYQLHIAKVALINCQVHVNLWIAQMSFQLAKLDQHVLNFVRKTLVLFVQGVCKCHWAPHS